MIIDKSEFTDLEKKINKYNFTDLEKKIDYIKFLYNSKLPPIEFKEDNVIENI